MKRLIATIAIVALVGAVFATPASAMGQKPLSGKIEITLYGVWCAEEGPFLTWAGTVVIDGTTYGWADFPTGPSVEDGKFVYFEEYWTIFALNGESVTPEIACDASRVVLAGLNDGWGTPGATAKANGTVEYADPDGPFDDVAVGSRMFWRGMVTEFVGPVPLEFKATLHIQPTR